MLDAAQAYCDAKSKAEKKAALIMSIPYFISACISPFLGFVVDRIGKRAVIATVAPALLVAVHLTLARTGLPGQYPLIGQGLAYSAFAAALWPSVPYVVDDKYVGTAYGVITAVQNLGNHLCWDRIYSPGMGVVSENYQNRIVFAVLLVTVHSWLYTYNFLCDRG